MINTNVFCCNKIKRNKYIMDIINYKINHKLNCEKNWKYFVVEGWVLDP